MRPSDYTTPTVSNGLPLQPASLYKQLARGAARRIGVQRVQAARRTSVRLARRRLRDRLVEPRRVGSVRVAMGVARAYAGDGGDDLEQPAGEERSIGFSGSGRLLFDPGLFGLNGPDGGFAAGLDRVECFVRYRARSAQGGNEVVGGGDGVLDGHQDAVSADGGDHVGGVADEEQPGPVPVGHAFQLDGEQRCLIESGEEI